MFLSTRSRCQRAVLISFEAPVLLVVLCVRAGREDAAAKEDERAELWQADWDDEETTEDFQAKLRQELDRDMKD
jgi:hypothetical protein